MTTPAITPDLSVVGNLLACFRFNTRDDLRRLTEFLGKQVAVSMTNTTLYSLPLSQGHDPQAAPDQLCTQVHPFNLAAALMAVVESSIYFCHGPEQALSLPEGLMLWNGQWVLVRDVELPGLPQLRPPVDTVPPPAPAPAPAPPAAPPPAPVAAAPAPAPVAAAPAAAAPQSEIADAFAVLAQSAPAPAAAPITAAAPAAPAAPPATPPKTFRVHAGLPDVNVLADRTSATGRAAKSAFAKVYQKRAKFGAAPYWIEDFMKVFPGVLSKAPSEAANTDSTAPTTVMAYGLAIALLQQALKEVPGEVTVEALRAFIADVDAQLTASPAGPVMYDLYENLLAQKSAT
jgi:hypothetical protein